jgi:hypothetical protein
MESHDQPKGWMHGAGPSICDKRLMAVLGHPRRMRNGLVIRPTLVLLGAASPLISLTWGPRAPRTVAASTRRRFPW